MARRQHGVVVTHVDHLGQLADCLKQGEYDTVKVVTGWGIQGGWTPESRSQLLHMAPHVIVRTVAGDPSAVKRGHRDPKFPKQDLVASDVAPWYDIRQDIMVEIGNEPNVIVDPSEQFIWEYKFFLSEAIDRCRKEFPQAELISPGLISNPDRQFERFHAIAADAFQRCNYIGLHFYEHVGFATKQQRPTTNELRLAIRVARQFYGHMLWYVTEYGVNHPDTLSPAEKAEKGRRYAGMSHYGESGPALPDNVTGLTYYHLNTLRDIDPQYHIFPEGDAAFGSRLRATPPPEPAPLGRRGQMPQRFAVVDPCSLNPEENFASVRQAPHLGAIEAGRLQPGTRVLVDGIADGWAHLARANRIKDLGFVQISLLRQVS